MAGVHGTNNCYTRLRGTTAGRRESVVGRRRSIERSGYGGSVISMTDITELVRRDPEEIWSQGNFDVIDEIFASEFILYDPAAGEVPYDREDYREYVETYREAFPDVEYTVETAIAEGAIATIRYTARGTQEGEFM